MGARRWRGARRACEDLTVDGDDLIAGLEAGSRPGRVLPHALNPEQVEGDTGDFGRCRYFTLASSSPM